MKNGDLPAMIGEYEYQFKNGDTKTFKGNGLTKREQFAMAAMQGLCSDVKAMFDGAGVGESIAGFIARQSVAAADALLAELERNK